MTGSDMRYITGTFQPDSSQGLSDINTELVGGCHINFVGGCDIITELVGGCLRYVRVPENDSGSGVCDGGDGDQGG